MKKYLALGYKAATLAVVIGPALCSRSYAQASAPDKGFADMSLEQLMDVPVTSVAKQTTKLGESPAAITVITQEDLRSLGITNLPDALRLVPGVDVAQINSHEWAVSARGFNNEFANKLLVLIDGRSVYSGGFGGVVWGMQNIVMEDIERIEVIRGAGGSLWGANAVNGVINIITKGAADTQGGLVSAAGGSIEQPDVSLRYGDTFSPEATYRAYLKYDRDGGMQTLSGASAPDEARDAQAGARTDWTPTHDDRITVQGDYSVDRFVDSQYFPSLTAPYDSFAVATDRNDEGNVLSRWTHQFQRDSSLAVQVYVDTLHLEESGTFENSQTVDFDAQHNFALGDRNAFVWGLGYRHVDGQFGNSAFVSWNPQRYTEKLTNLFVQDQISIVPDRLIVTLGDKEERNIYTGVETQPDLRVAFKPTSGQTVWAAASRAERIPSRADLSDLVNLAVIPPAPGSPEEVIAVSGNMRLDVEDLLAYDIGYRFEAGPVAFDVAAFDYHYNHLILQQTLAPQFVFVPPQGPAYVRIDSVDTNRGIAQTHGVEIAGNWSPTPRWHLSASYSWVTLHENIQNAYLDGSPSQQAQVRSALSLPWNAVFTAAVYYADAFTAPYGIVTYGIPTDFRADVGMVWHLRNGVEAGLWGKNLLDSRHVEFTSYRTDLITAIPRSVLGRVTWNW